MTEHPRTIHAHARAVTAAIQQVDHLNAKHGEKSAQHAAPAAWMQIAVEELGEVSSAQQECDYAHEYHELSQLAADCLARMIGMDLRGER